VFEILRRGKSIFIRVRSSLKIIFLLIIAAALIIGIVSLAYRPAYGVTLNGEFIGYTTNKSKLQNTINEYMKTGDGENVAFVDIEEVLEYSLCLLKKEKISDDNAIIENVKELGTTYYEYYAIVLDNEEKNFTKTKAEAEEIISQLKEQRSSNIDKIAYARVLDTELQEFSDVESVVTALYVKPAPAVRYASAGYSVSNSDVYNKPELGIALISPTSGSISSRYGRRGGEFHSGLDIAGSYGTAIRAAAGGTVVSAGNSGTGYGIIVKIAHGNGVETLYAHCSEVYVSVGQVVSQGETIAAMGSTGRSTGVHLHLEVRLNGVSVNPEHYVY